MKKQRFVPLLGVVVVALIATSAHATPVVTGGRSASTHIGEEGAVLALGRRVELVVPSNLPIGRQTFTLSYARRRAPGRDVARGFVSVGPALKFDGVINALDKPLLLKVKANRLPPRNGKRWVVAVEKMDLCTDANRRNRLRNGLCASWSVFPAKRRAGGLEAQIPETGGMRIQFGLAPRGSVQSS